MNINKELRELGFYCKKDRYNYEVYKLGSSIVVNIFEKEYEVEEAISRIKNKNKIGEKYAC